MVEHTARPRHWDVATFMHDIIDNRQEKLIDHIEIILDSTERAKFAAGYFFVSGLTAIRGHLEDVKELRLLIENTTWKKR